MLQVKNDLQKALLFCKRSELQSLISIAEDLGKSGVSDIELSGLVTTAKLIADGTNQNDDEIMKLKDEAEESLVKMLQTPDINR